MSAHIHGLETRPTFDGNPLGWHNTEGETGPGFNSLFEDSYYSQFNNPDEVKSWLAMPSELVKRSKVVKAPNDQLPGMLFYHDHAMKSTLYNVQNGFSGIYIIYDDKA
jgi:FtsP/CotA-like multicopper oxidase with cupredoxin domain